jgi:hypothetical protein
MSARRRVIATVSIDRPVEEVFAFLANGENDLRFRPRLTGITRSPPGGEGVGTLYSSTARELGLRVRHEHRITELERPRRIRWVELTRTPVFVAEGGYDLLPVGDGTELTLFCDFGARGAGALLFGAVVRRRAREAPALAERLKRAVEAG